MLRSSPVKPGAFKDILEKDSPRDSISDKESRLELPKSKIKKKKRDYT